MKNERRKWDGRKLPGGKVEGKGQKKIGMGKKKNERRSMDRKLARGGEGRVKDGR